MMGSFGENLRREREMRGVTLEEISSATKISVRFLKSLEKEEFSKLPGGIFVRSFIRSYARFLGLDEEPVLAEFQLLAKDKTGSDLSRLAASRPLPAHASYSVWKTFALMIIVCGLLAAGFLLWRRSTRFRSPALNQASNAAPLTSGQKSLPPQPAEKAKSPMPSSPTAGTSAASETGVPAQGAAAPAASASPSGAAASAVPAPSAGQSGGLTLQIAATERSWVAVDADGKTVLQGVLDPGQLKTVQAQKAFEVVTGNAQGVVLTLNGQTLKPLGSEGEVKSVRLTRDDLKNAGP